MDKMKYCNAVERWGVFEAELKGYDDKNPFVDYEIHGEFIHKNEIKKVDGFYDGDGIYKVRFMPSFEGEYHFIIEGSFSDESYEGNFTVTAATGNNHGPVRVANTYHFVYEDGTPYYSIGTTCYVWTHQPEEMQKQTLDTLKNSAFNKIRFCVFPKHYDYNLKEPITYPYEGVPCDSSVLTKENFKEYNGNAPGNNWNFKKFNPKHFQLFENRIKDLMELGIEADLIIMHPYDRWGFSEMAPDEDDLYWNYVIARFSAYRNVWWSLANEYDLMTKKTIKDWERYAAIICEKDAYNHLRSIHNCKTMYDYKRPWVTHCSIQRTEMYKTAEHTDEWRETYGKPVVIDEMVYEGNINFGWGNITGEELIRRFWEATCRGGYAGHGETYVHPEDKLWWSHGGELYGTSPARLKFLQKILSETPGLGLMPIKMRTDEVVAIPESTIDERKKDHEYYLFYYSFNRPSFRDFYFDDVNEYEVEVIDTWEMTIENRGRFKGKFRLDLPGKQYMAVRIKKVK